jgi:hypothetical protein
MNPPIMRRMLRIYREELQQLASVAAGVTDE